MEIFKLMGRILVDSDEANKSISKTEGKMKGLGKKFSGGLKTAAKWGVGLTTAAVGVGTAAFAMTDKLTQGFDAISKGAQKVGITTDAYQEMDFWASQNGLSSDNMEKAVGRLNQRIGAAADGNKKYSGALEKLGVNMDDVRDGTVSTEDAMAKSIQSLSEMKNGQEQAALASELFGTKLGREMLPALQDGALSMEDAKKKAKELGIVIGEDSLAAGVKFQDTWDQLKRSMSAAGQQIMTQLIPIFQGLMDWVLNNMPMIQAVFKTVFDAISNVVGTVINIVQVVIGWFSALASSSDTTFTGMYEKIKSVFTGVYQTINEYMMLVWETLQSIWETIQELWRVHGDRIKSAVTSTFSSVWEIIQMQMTRVWGIIQVVWETIMTLWNLYGEQIVNTALTYFTMIWETISQVMTWIKEGIQLAWQFIDEVWRLYGEQIVNTVVTYFTLIWETIQMAMEYVRQIIDQVIGYVVPFIQGQLATLTAFWQQHGEQIMQAISNAIEIIKTVIQVGFGIIQGIIQTVFPYIQTIITNTWNIISSVINAAVGVIMGIIQVFSSALTGDFQGVKDGLLRIWNALWDGVKGVVSGAWGLISGSLSNLWNNISNWFTGLKDDALRWGRNMITGFIDGIKEKIGKVGDAVSGITGKVGSFLGFNSPAEEGEGRHIVEWGANMIDGFLDGVESQMGNAGRMMNDVVGNMKPGDLPSGKVEQQHSRNNDNTHTDDLLIQLIQAVKENRTIRIGEKEFNSYVGETAGNEGGTRIRRIKRGLPQT